MGVRSSICYDSVCWQDNLERKRCDHQLAERAKSKSALTFCRAGRFRYILYSVTVERQSTFGQLVCCGCAGDPVDESGRHLAAVATDTNYGRVQIPQCGDRALPRCVGLFVRGRRFAGAVVRNQRTQPTVYRIKLARSAAPLAHHQRRFSMPPLVSK